MINNFLHNQMYALCILAALSLRQHVQQNWQPNTTKPFSSQPSFNFLQCIDPSNSLLTEKIRRGYKHMEENVYRIADESKTPDFIYSCFQKLTEGAQTVIDNIGVTINNSKIMNNPWSKDILESIALLSSEYQEDCWA